MITMRERYQNDEHFKALVDMMVAHIHECNYTPSEMRHAAILASIIYEEHNLRPYYVLKDVEESLITIRNYVESKEKA